MLERLSVEPRGHLQYVGPALPAASAPAATLAVPSGRWAQLMGAALVQLIRSYQWLISPLFGACCRFEPSCSRYAIACIERAGPLRGVWWSLRRLCRCHPFCAGGHDPPPEFSA